ncbi:PP2C family protein-serine/threonine phosphatase [Vibrio hippocampi]|uniref:Regulator of RpoS n=1 Tax=Vibrio hippocampi TaxID=654686 RepID=A0ABM8ZH86_9VIBR|nr:SpoIIE family protein phosphatase [Vibrio hippocampi]CAH0525745.1 Regulator of RpoS [Vibrio hippocampi]
MAADEQTQSGRQQQILLVEDHKATQLLISSLLEKRGYKVTVANHGHEALEILDSSEQIQFVLSDWVMPKMDGVELCKRLKSTNYNRYIFFVLLSSQDDKDSIISGIDAGADDFVAKNTAIDELDARIRAGFRNLNLHIELLTKNQQLDQAYATIRGDLDSAGDFIRQLLPRKTAFNQAQMAYVSMPSAQIGGDILGYMELDEQHLGLYLIDVSGHGVASALLSFSVQQTLSVINGESSVVFKVEGQHKSIRSAADVVTKLNEIYTQDDSNPLYFTMVYAVLNRESGELNYCIAGHPPVIRAIANPQSTEFLSDNNFVVGMFDFADYKAHTIKLQPHDEIWFYTDGITEARVEGEFYSEQRLKDLIDTIHLQPFSDKPQHIVASVSQWQSSVLFEDDISILACKWIPESKESR